MSVAAENKKPVAAVGTDKKVGDGKKSDNKGKRSDNKGGRGGDAYGNIKVNVTRPNRSDMDVKVKALIAEITGRNEEIKKIRDAISKINDITKGSKTETDAAKATMSELQAERKVLMDERALILADRDIMRADNDALKNNESKIRAELKFKDLAQCEAKIKELERAQAQTSMTLNEEKKILKDIKTLNDSKKHFEKLNELQGARDKSKLTKEDIDKRYAEKMVQVDEVTARIAAHRAVMDKLFGANSAQREGIPAMYKQIDEIKADVSTKRDEIHQLEDAFRKGEDAYFAAVKEEKKRIEAERVAEAEKRKAEKEQREREALEAELRRVPFEAEIELCDAITAYLEKKVKVYESFNKLTQRATMSSSSGITNNTAIDTAGMKVLDRSNDVEELTGNLKKLAKKGKKQQKTGMALSATTVADAEGKKSEPVSHPAEKLTAFAYLSVSPVPATMDDIPAAVEALSVKKTYFQGLTRENKEVTTFADYLKKLEKQAEKEKKKEAKEMEATVVAEAVVAAVPTPAAAVVSEGPPGLATPPAVKASRGTVFTVDQLSSSELFPTL